ncbi:SDR family oxidoreductase, partial [Mycobacterium kansasii]
SVYGLIGVGNESAYCASKFAVRGFTESLRHELRGTGVRAVTIHPGGVKTNIARNGRLREDTEGWGRTPDDIAEEFDALAMTTPEAAADIIVE